MDTQEFAALAGRLDGIGHALLRLTAELEMQSLIDGSRVSEAWARAALQQPEDEVEGRSARTTLLQLAELLDDARKARQSRWIPG